MSDSNNNIKFRPLGARVLVQGVKKQEDIRDGIVIPDSFKDKEGPSKFKVIETGNKVESVTVGNSVLTSKYGLLEIKVDGESFYVVNEEDILGVFD